MTEPTEEPGIYRLKAAHMRKLADQSHSGLARGAYLALEARWLRLAERAGEIRAHLWGAQDSINQPHNREMV